MMRTERGCGERQENALYMCVAMSPHGLPIEHFLVDPPQPWTRKVPRSPEPYKAPSGNWHLFQGVGKTYYPFVSDFVEEARIMGVSKRVPNQIDLRGVQLSKKSYYYLIHPRAVTMFSYDMYERLCPTQQHGLRDGNRCIIDLWGISGCTQVKDKHEVGGLSNIERMIHTPSCKYAVTLPESIEGGREQAYQLPYQVGIFMRFPVTSLKFEYINQEGKIPTKIKDRILEAGFGVEVCQS
jgi:hypothetical protein